MIGGVTSTPPRDQTATIVALLDAAGRRDAAVPLRRAFVQQGTQRAPEPGPLQKIVTRHDDTALDLYLLFRGMASSDPWDVTRDARIWGRALGHGSDVDGGASVVSKAWRRLDEVYGLIHRERSGRLAKITTLDESGSRAPYRYPNGQYFKLPFAYWTAEESWHHCLSLPAKACLLIALSLRQPFILPAERGPSWYGISADSIDRGLRELQDHGLLTRRFTTVENWLSPTGQITEFHYRLAGPFRRRDRISRGHLAVVSA
ncbi:MAG: hypothetical protein JWO98_4017 [Frankiales bacterium]|nr:hypothetical protein [Frankiales bacterium]